MEQTQPLITATVGTGEERTQEALRQKVVEQWLHLQQVPVYVEQLITAHRGLIESIASQQ